jgi:CubicO group peptidase (beta-lactamase class C family)
MISLDEADPLPHVTRVPRSFLVALILLGAAAGAGAQSPRTAATRTASPAPALDQAQRRAIDAIFKPYDKPAVPGCALGVFRDGRIAYARGYGWADLERRVPITTATLFDIGSTSKQFAAASIALLAEEHKLSFGDEVRKYIPELPDYGAPLTIDNLMRHTSGLRDYAGLLVLAGHSLEEVTTDSQALHLIVHQRHLNFPSGTRFSYSNTGYFLLSVIVQRVSGLSLSDFARTHIFLPLGMTHTAYRNHFDMLIPNRALGYAPASTASGFRISMSNWEQTGDGSVQLSVDDALKWDENFYHPRVGGQTMVDELQQRGTLSNGDSIGYGRGLFLDTYRGLRRVQHGGDWIGYHAAYARYPRQHTSVIVLCNSDGISPEGLDDRVADVVLAKQFSAPKSNATVAARTPTTQSGGRPTATVAGGYFASATGEVFRIVTHDSGLVVEFAGQSFPLHRQGPLEYRVAAFPISITFVADSANAARALWLHTGPSDSLEAQRFVPATPDAAELASYAGRYHSPELGVTWPITFDHGALVLGTTPSELMDISGKLEPAMQGTFTAGGGTLHFVRDATGRVTGMTLSASRMRGIEFDRLHD